MNVDNIEHAHLPAACFLIVFAWFMFLAILFGIDERGIPLGFFASMGTIVGAWAANSASAQLKAESKL